jgi:hypothetical protein
MDVKRFEKARMVVTTLLVAALVAALSYGISSLLVAHRPAFALTVNKTFSITSAIYANYTAGTCTGTTTAKLYPTTTRCLAVTVHNPLSVVIDVKSLSMTVTSFTPTSLNPHTAPPCTTTMISPPSLFTSPFTIPANTTKTIDKKIKLSTSGTQDACENGTFHFSYTATATYTDTTTTTLAVTLSGTQATLKATVTPSNPASDPYLPGSHTATVHDVVFYTCGTTAHCTTKSPIGAVTLTTTTTKKDATAQKTTTGVASGVHYFEAAYPAKGTRTGTFTGSVSGIESVSATCRSSAGCLKFLTEPARTQTNHHIESGVLSTGTPIIVGVVTATGSLVKSFSGTVTISLIGNPIPPSKLSGVTTLPFTTGEAEFSTLSITHAGSYKLVATATPTTPHATAPTPATSKRFNIDTELVRCSPSHCSTTGSLGSTVTVKETTTTPTAGYISLGFYGPSKFSCGKPQINGIYDATAEVLTKTGASTPQSKTTWTLTYTISKTIVKTTGPEGKSKWQICWASTTKFTGTGPVAHEHLTTIGTTAPYFYVGILRSCSKSVKAPCVESLHSGNAGVEIITVKAAGDSYVRP